MSGTTKFGTGSLNTSTGANNSAFGNYAAYHNGDASCNTAIGSNALFNNTSAPHNTAIGAGSMFYNTTGQLNTAVGSSALEGSGTAAASVGNQNVAIGAQALYDNSGDYNVGVGCYALLNNTDGSGNTAVGYSTLQSNYAGIRNTAVGFGSLPLNNTGNQNTAVGNDAGLLLTGNSNYNTFLGGRTAVDTNLSLYSNSTALGYNATIDASNQIVLGTATEKVKIPGSYVGIGGIYDLTGIPHVYNLDVSGNINFTGNLYQNGIIYDASGGSSQWSNGSGNSIYYNLGTVGIGTNSPSSSYALDVSGNMRTTMDASINSITVGRGGGNNGTNTVLGFLALRSNTTGNNNVSTGYNSLTSNTTGPFNCAYGAFSLTSNTTGSGNCAFGYGSLNCTIGSNATEGNTAYGFYTGRKLTTSANYNTFLGFQADVSTNLLIYTQSTALGYQAIIDASNQMVFGTSTEKIKIPGSYVGIGGVYNPTGGFTLDVSGNLRTTMDASINSITVGRGSGNDSSNTAVGYQTLQVNTVGFGGLGIENTAVGYQALTNNEGGSSNTAVGYQALTNNKLGESQTAVGYQALTNSKSNLTSAFGAYAGYLDISGNRNTFIGYQADVSNNGVTPYGIYNNSTALGYNATIDASNQIVLGGQDLSIPVPYPSVYIPGSYVGIGTYNPGNGPALDVSGNLFISQASFGNLYQNQIGYYSSTTFTTPAIATGPSIQTLGSVTIPKGVWIVEGILQADITNALYYTFGLSSDSTNFDESRTVVRYIPTAPNLWIDHITTVFVLSTSTLIYLLGNILGGNSSNNSNIIKYTKIG